MPRATGWSVDIIEWLNAKGDWRVLYGEGYWGEMGAQPSRKHAVDAVGRLMKSKPEFEFRIRRYTRD